ncbi:replication initiation protein [Salmonella enterica]
MGLPAFTLANYRERLPKKPYCSDDLQAGIFPRILHIAERRAYIQHNPPHSAQILVFDIDQPGGAMAWDAAGLPPPNFAAMNIENSHAHLFYCLTTGVRTAPDGARSPLRYLAAVEASMRARLGADEGYSGLISKNLLSDRWRVQDWMQPSYELGYLADFCDLNEYVAPARLPDAGLGRNCNLFEDLRRWAYKAIRQGWPDYQQWSEAVLTRAEMLNSKFSEPLPFGEIKATAKSVAKFTHAKFTEVRFSAIQAQRGAKGGKAKGEAYSGKREQALALAAKGATKQQIAKEVNVSRMTIHRWLAGV